jgi:hypothetical protein
MKRTVIILIIVFGCMILCTWRNTWSWSSYLGRRAHEKLAIVTAKNCIDLPTPFRKRCNLPVDEGVLYRSFSIVWGRFLNSSINLNSYK